MITQQRELQACNKSNIICNYLSAVYDTTYVRKDLDYISENSLIVRLTPNYTQVMKH